MSVSIQGLNHIGLIVDDINQAKSWFADTLGLVIIEDRGELVFLLAGNDVIAIKTPNMAVSNPEHGAESTRDYRQRAGWQSLDHYGFYAPSPEEVDKFAAHIVAHGATLLKGPYNRRDGRSVYFRDPLGLVGEYFFFIKPS